jgi:hypothetical protein
MPAASLPEIPTRQHAIEPGQCRWIIADEDRGAEALMCGAPAEPRRAFCADHAALVYLKIPDEEEGAQGDAGAVEMKQEEPKPEAAE